MRAPLARGALSKIVAQVLRTKAAQENRTCWNSTIEFIEASDTWFTHVGSGYAKPYTQADDPRLAELRKSCEWFESWYENVKAIPEGQGDSFTKKGKEKMFMSRQTFWALKQTTYAFIGMCKHYLPTAPEGCGIRACRCSQDPVERFFVSALFCDDACMMQPPTTCTNRDCVLRVWCVCTGLQSFVRSTVTHPNTRQALDATNSWSTTAALSKSANNGTRGKKTRQYDETSKDLPLSGRLGGKEQQKAQEERRAKHQRAHL
jgi:hypothetical protein